MANAQVFDLDKWRQDSEVQHSRRLANIVLDRSSGDPDNDLAVLSRQLLRGDERHQALITAYREQAERIKALEATNADLTNIMTRISGERDAAVARVKALEASPLLDRIKALEGAMADFWAGWRYIREHYGDLYGIGWDRCENAAQKLLTKDQAAKLLADQAAALLATLDDAEQDGGRDG